ncbi:MAG TPA: sulfotransferase [Chroococcidiopsis sp.]
MNSIIRDTQKSLVEIVRGKKNKLVRDYLEFRIHASPEPQKILFRPTPCKFLFILSHMRSGSSLLTHILSSNPEIIGLGETHTVYRSDLDLKQLTRKLYTELCEVRRLSDLANLRMNHQYILDKILHNSKLLDYSFLASEYSYNIFLLREPQRSLSSILDLKPHWDEATAVEYYGDRLRQLERYSQFINNPERTLVVTYEQLLNQTELTLSKLRQFLSLSQPLSEDYHLLKTTGKPGFGDHKGNIKAGRIVRDARKLNSNLSEPAIDAGQAAFDHCMEVLAQYCTVV